MTRVRTGLGALGVLALVYGVYLVLSRQDLDQWVSLAIWLAGGVILHDAVVAPVVLLLALAGRRLPLAWKRPSTALVVVLGSVTLLAIPVLGRFGARPDNPTLLDRPYGWSWLVLAVVSVMLVVAAGLVDSRRAQPRADGPDRPDRPDRPDALDGSDGGADGQGAGGR